MKACLLLTAVACSIFASGLAAQEPAKPSPEHAHFKQLAGEWAVKIKCHVPEKGMQESEGAQSSKLELGGLFLTTEFKGKLGDMPFEGRGINAYDPHQKKYTGVWVDTMSPALYHTEGEWDKAGKTFTEAMTGPGPDGKPMKLKMVTEVKDADHVVMKMMMADQTDPMMEMHLSRKK